MRLNESLKRAIYSDIMNDVARVVKSRVNEETLPTGIDLDKELDSYEKSQALFRDNAINKNAFERSTNLSFKVHVTLKYEKSQAHIRNYIEVITPVTYRVADNSQSVYKYCMILMTCYAVSKLDHFTDIKLELDTECDLDIKKLFNLAKNNKRIVENSKKLAKYAATMYTTYDTFGSILKCILNELNHTI